MNTEVTGHLNDEAPIDYFDDIDVAPAEDALTRIVRLADRVEALALLESEQAAALAETQEERNNIVRNLIPSILDEIGVKDLSLSDGRKVTLDPKVKASISEANKPDAFGWLEDNDFDGIIKTKVVSDFERGELEEARKIMAKLRDEGINCVLDRSVHNMTLVSFVKERLAEGTVLPESIGVFEYKEAKIKAAKGKAAKPKK